MCDEPKVLNKYPAFVSNQVLTAQLLNNLRDYLDGQNRLALLRGAGRGIACGLDIEILAAGTQIKITDGYGFTSEGYLVSFKGGIFGFAEPYTDPIYKMLNETPPVKRDIEPKDYKYPNWATDYNPNGASPSVAKTQIGLWELTSNSTTTTTALNAAVSGGTTFLTDKVVLLYFEINPDNLRSCISSDCNNKGWEIALTVKPLLVKQSDLKMLTVVASVCQPLAVVRVPRLHAAFSPIRLSAVSSASDFGIGYKKITDAVVPYLDTKISELYTKIRNIIGLGTLTSIVTKVTAVTTGWTTIEPRYQYLYDFVKDIADAYNELAVVACRFLNLECCKTGNFGRHLMLGAGNSAQGFRHIFEPAPPLQAAQNDVDLARKLFQRLDVLIQNFNPSLFTNVNDIKISPSYTEGSPFRQRAVPFYYKTTNGEVAKYWQPQNCCIQEDMSGYNFQNFPNPLPATPILFSSSAVLNDFDWNYAKNNFFRIEGHINQPIGGVKSALTVLKTTQNLEFEVLDLPLVRGANTVVDDTSLIQQIRKTLYVLNQNLADNNLRQYDLVQLDTPVMLYKDYNNIFIEITSKAIKDALLPQFDSWQLGRCGLILACNINFLQSDYLILRGELLSHFKHFNSVFIPLMQVYESSFSKTTLSTTIQLTKRDVGTLTQMRLFGTYLDWLAEKLLPKDVMCFSYPFFIEIFKEWHRLAYELQAFASGYFANNLIESLVSSIPIPSATLPDNNITLDILPDDLNKRFVALLQRMSGNFNANTQYMGSAFVAVADVLDGVVAGLSDVFAFMNTYLEHKIQQQLAAVYYGLTHVIKNQLPNFSEFAQKYTGLEHLSGVEKGGTFLLVTDTAQQVVADFALSGKVEMACCCDFRPTDICLPPVAVTDIVWLVVSDLSAVNNESAIRMKAQKIGIDVLKNDYSLNTPLSACQRPVIDKLTITLANGRKDAQSELNGKVLINNGLIDYNIDLIKKFTNTGSSTTDLAVIVKNKTLTISDLITFDFFDYELSNECGLSDRGKVLVVLIPERVFRVEKPAPKPVPVTIFGSVRSSKQEVLVGSTVSIQGTTIGATTDPNGSYKINTTFDEGSTHIVTGSMTGFFSNTVSFTVPNGGVSIPVDIVLSPRTILVGGQIFNNGLAVRGAKVSVANMDIPPVVTDEDGFYKLELPETVIPDKIAIIATHPDIGNAVYTDIVNPKDIGTNLKTFNLQLVKAPIDIKPEWNINVINKNFDNTIFKNPIIRGRGIGQAKKGKSKKDE